jgi:hypothetical protein
MGGAVYVEDQSLSAPATSWQGSIFGEALFNQVGTANILDASKLRK